MPIQAQKIFRYEVQIESDNDTYYTLNTVRDQYYSSGLYIRFRHLTDSSRWSPKIKKIIRSYAINHRIFSPKYLWEGDVNKFDRPYAGQISLALSNEYYFRSESYLNVKLEIGWMGPSIETDRLHYHLHKVIGATLPRGWMYQIEDSPIINLWGTYANKLWSTRRIDLTGESHLAVGTAFNHIRQEVVFRFSHFKRPVFESARFDGLLDTKNIGSGVKEAYFFFSPGVEYVAYNSTIEGNFVGKQSPHVEQAVRWVYQMSAGFMISWTKFDFGVSYYRRTRETTEATFHRYVGIRLNQRF